MEYIPYTYLIGWSELNLWYYGSKYGNDANPDTLWKLYFTSSNKVDYMRQKYGEPDVIQIRKTFYDAKSCTAWEYNVLKRLLSKNNQNRCIWINQNIGFGEFYKENNVPEYLSFKRHEYLNNRTEEQKQRDYESRLRGASNEEGRRKQSELAKARQSDPVYKQKMQELYATEEFKKRRSEASLKMHTIGSESHNNFLNAVTSESYKEHHRKKTTKMWEDKNYKAKVSEGHARYHSDPENLKKKSEAAKAASANRIATRHLNSISNDILHSISFDQICHDITNNYNATYGFDIERLKKKYDVRMKNLKN